jgi:hypothetical protein
VGDFVGQRKSKCPRRTTAPPYKRDHKAAREEFPSELCARGPGEKFAVLLAHESPTYTRAKKVLPEDSGKGPSFGHESSHVRLVPNSSLGTRRTFAPARL